MTSNNRLSATNNPTPDNDRQEKSQGAIAWMAQHSVAANLLMLFLLIGGYFTLGQIKQEVFPEISTDTVSISVVYPGATPADIATGIITPIEASIQGIDGIKQITSTAREGSGTVLAELFDHINQQDTLQDIKNTVDRITTLPTQAERAIIQLPKSKRTAISLIVYGNQDLLSLQRNARRIKNELMTLPEITLAELDSPHAIEISLSVQQTTLRELGLSLNDIAQQVRRHAQQTVVGSVTTKAGEILIRTDERRQFSREFFNIPITTQLSLSNTQPSFNSNTLRLSDIAVIKENFSESQQLSLYNGFNASRINIYSLGNESPITVAKAVKAYVSKQANTEALKVAVFSDRAELYKGRVNLLLKNAGLGLILVLLVLTLFLNAKLAFWVMLGLPISIMGSFIVFQFTGASFNMVSLFAFIITLGIVVDDAVIVGEAIYEKRQQGISALNASCFGAKEMVMPVSFAVLTNMIAFMPLLFVPGVMGDIFGQIPSVVITVLCISWVEALFILPAHLSHTTPDKGIWAILNIPQRFFGKQLDRFAANPFNRLIKLTLHHRYLCIACALAMLIIALGLFSGGHLRFTFLPKIDRNTITATATLPFGSPYDSAEKIAKQLMSSTNSIAVDDPTAEVISSPTPNTSHPYIKGLYATIGAKGSGNHTIRVTAKLVATEDRAIGGIEFAQRWREATPDIPGVVSLSFSGSTGVGRGSPIQIELSHPNQNTLKKLAIKIKNELENYEGVINISNGILEGKEQLNLSLTPQASQLKLTTADIAQQIRHAFYGVQVFTQQRAEEEIKVFLRLSENERENLDTLQTLAIKTPQGAFAPLHSLATMRTDKAATKIERTNGQRILKVTASIDSKKANLNQILLDIKQNLLPQISVDYPQLQYSLEGQENTRQEALRFLNKAFLLALGCIFGLLAIAFKSYSQPLAVMLSIPFGCIGAIGGHYLLGYDISIISLVGIIGLSGIVINDALVLIVTINRAREETPLMDATTAAINASVRRLRPILLTTLTTFIGLLPMLFETSVQARFLIPMAISISFGLLFATLIILALVPSIYLVIEDVKKQIR